MFSIIGTIFAHQRPGRHTGSISFLDRPPMPPGAFSRLVSPSSLLCPIFSHCLPNLQGIASGPSFILLCQLGREASMEVETVQECPFSTVSGWMPLCLGLSSRFFLVCFFFTSTCPQVKSQEARSRSVSKWFNFFLFLMIDWSVGLVANDWFGRCYFRWT